MFLKKKYYSHWSLRKLLVESHAVRGGGTFLSVCLPLTKSTADFQGCFRPFPVLLTKAEMKACLGSPDAPYFPTMSSLACKSLAKKITRPLMLKLALHFYPTFHGILGIIRMSVIYNTSPPTSLVLVADFFPFITSQVVEVSRQVPKFSLSHSLAVRLLCCRSYPQDPCHDSDYLTWSSHLSILWTRENVQFTWRFLSQTCRKDRMISSPKVKSNVFMAIMTHDNWKTIT